MAHETRSPRSHHSARLPRWPWVTSWQKCAQCMPLGARCTWGSWYECGMSVKNRQVLLVSRPQGEASTDNFQLVESELPALADGQVLVRHHYLSLDPYMRGR